MTRLKIKIFSVLMIFSFMSVPSFAVCKNDPTALFRAMMIFLSTINNMFPIKVGGVPVVPGGSDQSYSEPPGTSISPICGCLDPFPRIGISLSFWEVIASIDTVKDPYCFRTYGIYVPLPFNEKQFGGELTDSATSTEGNVLRFFHTHSFPFFPFKMLGMFLDAACFQASDLATYLSEVDPICGSNDEWCTILGNPEALLLSNAQAQIICNFADSVASTVKYPLDVLFFCAGPHSVYPTTGNCKSSTYVGAAGLAFEKTLYKMHRAGLLLGRFGSQGLCSAIYLPIWRKSVYNKQLIFPVAHKNRVPIGYPASLYESGKNPPIPGKNDNLSWFLYRFRSCCAF